MTAEEFQRPAARLKAAFNFLDFSNAAVFETWFEVLKGYEVGEVMQGVTDWIANQSETPHPADIKNEVNRLRERRQMERDFNNHILNKTTVRCKECMDNGFVNIWYPNYTEAVRPCDCEAGKRFMPNAVEGIESRNWRELFRVQKDEQTGEYPTQEAVMKEWELVRLPKLYISYHQDIKDKNGNVISRQTVITAYRQREVHYQWKKKGENAWTVPLGGSEPV